MAHLNMMGNQWNAGNQGWHGNSFNGSNMSLNMMPNPGYVPNDHQMWNPWMQQQFTYPMMPGGKAEISRMSVNFQIVFFPHRNAADATASFKSGLSSFERSIETFDNELEK